MPKFIQKSDDMPTGVITPGASGGSIYLDGPWSLITNEVISLVVQGGSNLAKWIPNRPVNSQFAHVAHLTWVAPDGMDGSESYGDYLAGKEPVDVCEFGDDTQTWQTCEYRVESSRIVKNSDRVNIKNLNYKMFDNQPILTVRGPVIGSALRSDWDWALARAGIDLENHMNWNIVYGDPQAFPNTSIGLDKILRVGYVRDHKVGPGACDYTDPIVWSGAGKTIEEVIRLIRALFRKIYGRASDRGYKLTKEDVCLTMSRAHWSVIADFLAANGTLFSAGDNVSLNSSIRDLRQERRDLTQASGLYDGYIPLPEQDLYVMIDQNLGKNVTFGMDSRPGVIGDMLLLTRRFAGMIILEEQWLDYNTVLQANNVIPTPDLFTQQNGMLLATYLDQNNICFSYAVETERRLVSKMQHLQGRINDVLFETEVANEIEAVQFTHPNYYAFEGRQSGVGVPLIVGLR